MAGDDRRAVHLRPGTLVEPLVNSFHAWLHLLAPASLALHVKQSHLPLLTVLPRRSGGARGRRAPAGDARWCVRRRGGDAPGRDRGADDRDGGPLCGPAGPRRCDRGRRGARPHHRRSVARRSLRPGAAGPAGTRRAAVRPERPREPAARRGGGVPPPVRPLPAIGPPRPGDDRRPALLPLDTAAARAGRGAPGGELRFRGPRRPLPSRAETGSARRAPRSVRPRRRRRGDVRPADQRDEGRQGAATRAAPAADQALRPRLRPVREPPVHDLRRSVPDRRPGTRPPDVRGPPRPPRLLPHHPRSPRPPRPRVAPPPAASHRDRRGAAITAGRHPGPLDRPCPETRRVRRCRRGVPVRADRVRRLFDPGVPVLRRALRSGDRVEGHVPRSSPPVSTPSSGPIRQASSPSSTRTSAPGSATTSTSPSSAWSAKVPR